MRWLSTPLDRVSGILGQAQTPRQAPTRCCGPRRDTRRCFRTWEVRAIDFVNDLNAAGQSVGAFKSSQAPTSVAMLWSPSGAATVLQDVGSRGLSRASDINHAGQSVGYSTTASGYEEAVLWSSSGTATSSKVRSALIRTPSVAINNSGYIIWTAGYSSGQNGEFYGRHTGTPIVLPPPAYLDYVSPVTMNQLHRAESWRSS